MSNSGHMVANRDWRDFNSSTNWCIPLKPGSATKPFYGIKPVIVDKNGKEIKGAGEGRFVYRNHGQDK